MTQNPEATRQISENLQSCKGRGKMRVAEPKLIQPSNMSVSPVQPVLSAAYAPGIKQSRGGTFGGRSSGTSAAESGKSFQSSYAEVFKNRRGIFEQGSLFNPQNHKNLDNLNLAIP